MNKTWNKTINTETQTARKRNIFDGKIKEILLISVLALTLVFAVWKVFYDGDTKNVISVSGSETEQKISLLCSNGMLIKRPILFYKKGNYRRTRKKIWHRFRVTI